MTLDPQVQQFLERAGRGFSDYVTLTPAQVRKQSFEVFRTKPKPPEIAIARTENKIIPGPTQDLKIRIFTPHGDPPFPGLMYFHGGGFVTRDQMEMYEQTCRMMCRGANCVVVAVDYRLAPENPFPAAPEDCYAATCWVANHAKELHIDPSHLGVWGESCGGNLATVIPMMARDHSGPKLSCQILVTPMLDCTMNTPSYRDNATGYYLTKEAMQWFWRHYLSREEDQANVYASPTQAKDLRNLPSAFVVTVEYDPMCDEGNMYAKRLTEANVHVIHRSYPGLIHGFFDLYTIVHKANEACQDIIGITSGLLQGKKKSGNHNLGRLR